MQSGKTEEVKGIWGTEVRVPQWSRGEALVGGLGTTPPEAEALWLFLEGKSPSGVQGRSPGIGVWGTKSPEAEVFGCFK